jgi:hypothetical protein
MVLLNNVPQLVTTRANMTGDKTSQGTLSHTTLPPLFWYFHAVAGVPISDSISLVKSIPAALVFSDVPLVPTTALTPAFADVLATVICFPAVAGIHTVTAGNHH